MCLCVWGRGGLKVVENSFQTKVHLNLMSEGLWKFNTDQLEKKIALIFLKKLVEKKKGKNEQLNLQCLQTALGSSGKDCTQANCCSSFIIPKRSSLVSIFSYRIFTASKLVQKGDNWDLHIWHTCQGFRLNKVMYSA